MIITRTPYRMSFFGGGTDYPDYYLEHGGDVISTSIDKYCYLSCRKLPPFFEHKYRIVYSKVETVRDVDEIIHPSVRHVLKMMSIQDGLEINHVGDLPARSGIGSSSSFTVGLLNVLYTLRGQYLDKRSLAKLAIHVEQKLIKEPVGSQDQICASFGGFNRITFDKSGEFSVTPIVMKPEKRQILEGNLMMFFSGVSRFSSDYSIKKIKNLVANREMLEQMKQMVSETLLVLGSQNGAVDDFGKLMHESWQIKKSLAEGISSLSFDEIYDNACAAGALGGKLMGAGGGGFFVFYVPKSRQNDVKTALSRLVHVPFSFTNSGSEVCVYQPQS